MFEGKFTGHDRFKPFVDLSLRVSSDIMSIRDRFQRHRSSFLEGDELDAHMRYYDLVSILSWLQHDGLTRSAIDRVVNI